MDSIRIRGARTHNLKNLSVELPRNKLVVITGLSGSGKSSFAFDTLYAEGQRRYVESLRRTRASSSSSWRSPRSTSSRAVARDRHRAEGRKPQPALDGRHGHRNPRLPAASFRPRRHAVLSEHGLALEAQTVSEMIDQLAALPEDTRIMVLAPVVAGRKGEQADLLDELRAQGFTRVRIDGTVHELDGKPRLAKNVKHSVDVVIDRVRVRPDARQRLAESLETALRHADGKAVVVEADTKKEHVFSARYACPACDYSLPELEPRLFSFNNPMGACPRCDGLGSVEFFDPKRIVAHPNLSLASGAIRGWDRRNHFYYSMLQSLAKHYRFDIESPWEMLDERIQNLILYGSGTGEDRVPVPVGAQSDFAERAPVRGRDSQSRTALSRD